MRITVRTGTIEEVVDLSLEIPELKNPYSASEYYQRLKEPYVILVADVEGIPVGFKVGYDRFKDGKIFYSWLGGVHPGYRQLGVAKMLLEKMEVWCRLKGYQYLQFKTFNRNKSMIHFAIDHGFEVIDFKREETVEESKIYFEKKL